MNADEIRAKIEAAKQKWPEVEVRIQEWDVTVKVRGLTYGQRIEFAKWNTDNPGETKRQHFKLLSLSVCDESGAPIFPDNDGIEFEGLPGRQVGMLTSHAFALSYMDNDEKEELEKN